MNGKASWGGQITYSSSPYKRHLLTGGETDAYTGQYNYIAVQNYLASVPKNQPIRFDGTIEERMSMAQIGLFGRRYLFTNKASWYIGLGLNYGLIWSNYASSIKLYATDKPTSVYLGDIIRYAQPFTTQRRHVGVSYEIGWQKGSKFGLLAQYNSSYIHQICLLMNYYF